MDKGGNKDHIGFKRPPEPEVLHDLDSSDKLKFGF